MSEASANGSEARGGSRSETARTGIELEYHSAERRNLSQIEGENKAPFLRGDERWDAESRSEDESSSRSQPERSMSKPQPHTSNPAGNFMKWPRERWRGKAQLVSVPQPSVKEKHMGHRKARTRIKEATFWDNDSIMSGLDCGHTFAWNRYTAKLVMLIEGDQHVVSCVQSHPLDLILTLSRTGYNVELWAPLHEDPPFEEEHAQKIIRHNGAMLEETTDAIPVLHDPHARIIRSPGCCCPY